MTKNKQIVKAVMSDTQVVQTCLCAIPSACSVVALAVAMALAPSSPAQAANGQCIWEGGPGAPTYPSCQLEDCINKGGLAQCVAPIVVPLQPGPPVDGQQFQYIVTTTNEYDAGDFCIAAGGTWNGFYGHPPCTVPYDDFAANESAAVALADAFIGVKFQGQGSLSSDTGWGAAGGIWGLSGSLYVDNGQILYQSERDRYYNYPNSSYPYLVGMLKSRSVICPGGYQQRTTFTGAWDCYRAAEASCPLCGDPVSPAYGEALQNEVDFDSKSIGGLSVGRFYRSMGYFRPPGTIYSVSAPNDVWRWSYQRTLYVIGGNAYLSAVVQREDGVPIYFDTSGKEILNRDGAAERLVANGPGWTLTRANGDVESYNSAGQLTSLKARAGTTTHLTYNSTSISIADDFGHTLVYTLNASGFIGSVTLPDARVINYGYNSSNYLTSVTYADGTSRTYTYDPASGWLLTGIIDEAAIQYVTYTYSNGAVASETHAGNVGNWSYQNGMGTSGGYALITDPLNNRRQYNYTNANGTIKISGEYYCPTCGLPSNETYDANGNPSSQTDGNSNQTTYIYDATRNLETSHTEAVGSPQERTVSTQWDPAWRQPDLITEANRTTAWTYDSNGNALTKTISDTTVTPNVARTWTYTYNTYGQVLTANGPRTDVTDKTTYSYYTCATGGKCGQLHTVTDAAAHVTTYLTYNANGKPLTLTDPNGVLTTLTYDKRQRVISRQVSTETTSFSYYPTGLLKEVTLPDGSYLLYTYDTAHRLTQLSDGAGNKIVYTLDAMGNRTAENAFDPSSLLHRTHTRVFNTLNQLNQDINAAGTPNATTTYGYDNQGNRTTIAAPMSRNTTDGYDALNRLSQITDPASGNTYFGYDANDNLISVKDPRGLTTAYTYTGFGDLKTQVSPDTGTTTNTYDSGGNLKTSTDARAAISTFVYDALNRPTSVAYKKGGVTDQTITFTYDAGTYGKGRLTGASDASHSMSWTYDALGRVTGKGQTVGTVPPEAVGYAYTNGNLTTLTTPSGQILTYGYNANHQLVSITLNGTTTILNNVTYEPLGAVNAWTWGNGTSVSRTYNTDGLISQISAAGAKTLSYDDALRVQSISDTSVGASAWTYGYDLLDRITSGVGGSTNRGWTYDANGNRKTETGSAASTYTISATRNRINSITGALPRTYTYDAAGDVLTYSPITATYYDRGRLKTLQNGSAIETLVYNALGQMVQTSGGAAGTVVYMYDESGHLLGEYSSSGAFIEETVWLGDIPVATLRPSGSTVSVYYIEADHLNTPRQVSRASDNMQMWTWFSDPFGTTAANSNPVGAGTFIYNLRFPGQIYDSQAGLQQNTMRDYDPAIGRYVESDPLGLRAGINTYAYASLNPLSRSDNLGLCDGKWVMMGSLVPTLPTSSWQVVPSPTCKCFWMCMPCRGSVAWAGNIYGLPSTWGITVVNFGGSNPGSAGIRPTTSGPAGGPSASMGGDYSCVCKKPDPEMPCKQCFVDSSPAISFAPP